jgi:hypothetical protein
MPSPRPVADDFVINDRRLAVNSGVERGRDAAIALMSTVIATRGNHLLLARASYSGSDHESDAFRTELLGVVEARCRRKAHGAGRVRSRARRRNELWSEVTQSYAAMNRQELPATTMNWTTADHRVRTTFDGAYGTSRSSVRAARGPTVATCSTKPISMPHSPRSTS